MSKTVLAMTSPATKPAAKAATKVAVAMEQMVVAVQKLPGSSEQRSFSLTMLLPIDSQQARGVSCYGPPLL